ncbi:MAG: FkbM family methyltransferase [Vicinamibacteria bacterium]
MKRLAMSFGYRITRRASANRFQAIDECLLRMKQEGFKPDVILDVGANRGQFYRIAQPIYPEAFYHLIEPQPACGEALRELARSERVEYHPIALTEPGIESIRLLGVGDNGGSTGAYVGKPAEHDANEIAVPATTLDSLLSEKLGKHERTSMWRTEAIRRLPRSWLFSRNKASCSTTLPACPVGRET